METRINLTEKNNVKLSVRTQCNLLSIPRSQLYYESNKKDETALLNSIREIWLKHPYYGYRRISVILKRDYGFNCNHKRVKRLMNIAGIQAIYPKPKLSNKNKEEQIYPYLLKEIKIESAHQVWMVDITYLKVCHRFLYLVALIDVYSRFVVGWELSYDLDTTHCIQALNNGLKENCPVIVNSDQGSQFTSKKWTELLKNKGILISMDGVGRCQDNIYIERFWRSMKYEAYYLNEYENYETLYLGVKNYIEFYNYKRPHQSLNYQTPYERLKRSIELVH